MLTLNQLCSIILQTETKKSAVRCATTCFAEAEKKSPAKQCYGQQNKQTYIIIEAKYTILHEDTNVMGWQ